MLLICDASVLFEVLLLSAYFHIEVVELKTSFMSEEAILFLGLIGLLGEYCPTSRKKNVSSLTVCISGFPKYPEFCGCSSVQPCTASEDHLLCSEISLEEPHLLKATTSLP
ncbi:hypothetical protein M9H77_05566 [Catharanthus roseus]|uniref:Uncharacterized protein n=1 Tax=Catharanthus roseus TaxID=4058 RepID=A0ACC0CHA2_CATRO|nr:hypothetical protein M9H77_05566 [Catharanthus roseus]